MPRCVKRRYARLKVSITLRTNPPLSERPLSARPAEFGPQRYPPGAVPGRREPLRRAKRDLLQFSVPVRDRKRLPAERCLLLPTRNDHRTDSWCSSVSLRFIYRCRDSLRSKRLQIPKWLIYSSPLLYYSIRIQNFRSLISSVCI